MNLLLISAVAVAAAAGLAGRRRGTAAGGDEPAGEAPAWLPYRWTHPRVRRLRWLRSVPRWARRAAIATLAALTYGELAHPWITSAALIPIAGGAAWALRLTAGRRRHFRDVVVPLWMATANMLEIPRGESVRAWMDVPYRLDADSAKVTIRVPRDYRGADHQRAELGDLVGRRLPGEWEASWDWGKFRVTFKHPPAPPKFVAYTDVVAELLKSPDARPLVGLGTRGEPVRGDFDQEAPHWALNMGTGAGKSSFLRLTIAQLARHTGDGGAVESVEILDPKRISQNWARGVPGVTIHKVAGSWVSAISEFRDEMERRYDVLDSDDSADFPRRFLVIEEMNSFTRLIKEWWDASRAPSDPRTPPAMNDLSFILNQGRQAKMHVIAVFQQMNARATGGSEARDQFGMKVLSRFSPAAWNMLVGTYPRPKSSRHTGRAIVLVGDDQRTVQMAFLTPEEARDFALNGRQSLAEAPTSLRVSLGKPEGSPAETTAGSVPGQSPDIAGRNGQTDSAPEGDDPTRPRLSVVPDPAPKPEPITGLRDGASFLGMDPEAFKKARQRTPIDGEFRRGTAPAWMPELLTEWHLNRPRAGARKLPERA